MTSLVSRVDCEDVTALPATDLDELAECGWRIEVVSYPNGEEEYLKIPLTEEEFLHPKEDYHLPSNVFHTEISRQVADILIQRYSDQPQVAIFSDLIVEWDDPNLKDNCPDVMVVFGLKTKPSPEKTRLVVAREGVRPAFILEVVSPRYRKADRQTKVEQYALAKVQEYVIVDRRRNRGQIFQEVLGYRLQAGGYEQIVPDCQGRVYCETIGVFISLQADQIVLEDAVTGQRLKNSREWREAAEQEYQRAEQESQRAEQARQRAEQESQRAEQADQRAEQERQKAEELQRLLDRYQQQFGDLEL